MSSILRLVSSSARHSEQSSTSLVGDVIMPIIGAITGGLDFSNYYLPLSAKVQSGLSYADAKKQGAVLGWGQFLTVALNFLIIAWVLVPGNQGHKQIEKGGIFCAAPRADTGSQTPHRNSRLAEKVRIPGRNDVRYWHKADIGLCAAHVCF